MAFLPMILMFAIIYFLLIRPQIRRQKQQRQMLSTLQKGDQVLTRGGIYGKIEAFKGKDDSQVLLDIGKGTKITVARAYIVGPASEPVETPKAD
ncbi:MAG: preprotein translocase subunit YajC [Fidelibacterota bacterium]|nr:MAG: preprotein translocase subunit YajC [Candidatus Neomarinimicrobiota bacterium]